MKEEGSLKSNAAKLSYLKSLSFYAPRSLLFNLKPTVVFLANAKACNKTIVRAITRILGVLKVSSSLLRSKVEGMYNR